MCEIKSYKWEDLKISDFMELLEFSPGIKI